MARLIIDIPGFPETEKEKLQTIPGWLGQGLGQGTTENN